MIDDFDFEDDINDLKDDGDAFLPPVNKPGSRLGLSDNTNKKPISSLNNSSALPVPNGRNSKAEKSAFPKASGKFGLKDNSDDEDDFGLDDINAK